MVVEAVEAMASTHLDVLEDEGPEVAVFWPIFK